MRSNIEIFLNGEWVRAAEFTRLGSHPYMGVFEYDLDYVFSTNPVPVSLVLPVTGERQGVDRDGNLPMCPSFLFDLIPQGRGRRYLCQQLNLQDGEQQDLVLAQYGAYAPIGNLRFDTAVQFYAQRVDSVSEVGRGGFSIEDMKHRSESFLEHIWVHAQLAAGTPGIQGVAPKFMLTQGVDDRWYADVALPDEMAKKHWLVKLPRGSHRSDTIVLKTEAAYLRIAEQIGLRTYGTPWVESQMLFVERFDRRVSPTGVQRLHQESLASIAQLRGFGMQASLFDLVGAVRKVVTDPAAETAEFIKRDIINMALRNTDNHARNTAVQRLPDGVVQLTPLYDLAPMYKDREMVVRSCRWKTPEGREVDSLAEIVELIGLEHPEQNRVLSELALFKADVERLPALMLAEDVDKEVIDECQASIARQVARLNNV